MLVPLEDRWSLLAVLEQEHGAREALLRLQSLSELKFEATPPDEQVDFIRGTACLYVAQSFKQSKELFRQAETSSWLVKPLLLYYAMLACVKGCLVFGTPDFMKSRKSRLHGLSTNNEFRSQLDLSKEVIRLKEDGMYALARSALELPPLPAPCDIQLHDILTRLPEIDGPYRLLFQKNEGQRNWLKIDGEILMTSPEGIRVGFNLPEELYKKIEMRLPETILAGFDKSSIQTDSGETRISYLSKAAWTSQPGAVSWGIPAVISSTMDNNYALIFPVNFDGARHDFSEIELTFMLMFYFSSIARYQPHLWLQLHAGAKDFSALLCRDILNSCENKFLRLVNSKLNYTISLPLAPQAPVIAQGDPPSSTAR